MKFGLAEIMLIAGVVIGIVIAGRMKHNPPRRKPPQVGGPRQHGRGSDADELAKLAWLHDNGKLTDKEYEQQKKKVLRRRF